MPRPVSLLQQRAGHTGIPGQPRVTCHYPGDRDREVWVGIMSPCVVLAQQGPWRDWVGLWGFGKWACWGAAGERTDGSSGHQGLRIEI